MSMRDLGVVGHNVGQRDLESHAKGQTTYYEDVHYPRMLHLKMHRSAEPHARIVSVDTSAAEANPGVVCVLTHEDLPGKKVWNGLAAVGVGPEDEPILAFDKVRWRGEPIVAVLGESAEAARAGAAKVKDDSLPGVFDVEEAIAGEAPALTAHWPNNHYIYPDDHGAAQIRFGDVEAAFAEADHIVEDKYQTSPIEQAPMETNGCIAKPGGDGRITVHTNTQAVHFARDNTAGILGVAPGKLRFLGGTVGGGFGGKVDVAGELLEASPDDLETDGEGNIHIKGVAGKSVSVGEVAGAAHFAHGKSIAGRGAYLKPPSPMDPETGECDPDSTQAHACTVVEVEVDTETGVVEVLDVKSVYEVGQQVNPDLVKGQIVGGAWMGIGHALYETTAPGYPAIDPAPVDFQNYLQPGPSETPEVVCEVLEYPAESGPYGGKGVGEMVTNGPIPAIVNAINNALDVRITQIPVTPEVVLRALDEKRAQAGG